MNLKLKKYIINILFLFCLQSVAQLSVITNLSSQYLVNGVLLGPGVVASNIQYTGAPLAIGYFNGQNSNIGLKEGVIISTGKATGAKGPNNSTNHTTNHNKPGNSELNAIAGQPTLDAAILEFDFVPSSDSVKFRYVFASEEYYEGVCTPYNDVFAFLMSGPGITGTTNLALIPGTTSVVSISSVNGGLLGQPIYSPSITYTYCNLANTAFYVDNATPPGQTVQYDGFTKVLTAKAKVIPCQTYHIKLGIADGGNDPTWDSGVFLEAGSFNTHYLSVTNQPKYTGGVLNSASVEGCGQVAVTFTRYDSIPYPRTINYVLSGSASPSDYIISSPNIYFAPGQETTTVMITPVKDNLSEGIETLSLTLVPDFLVCSGWVVPGASVSFIDNPANPAVSPNTEICEGSKAALYASGGNTYYWKGQNILDDPKLQGVMVSPANTTTYQVSISVDSLCPETKSVLVKVNPLPTVFAGNDTTINFGDPVFITATGTGTMKWITGENIGCKDCPVTPVYPYTKSCYIVEATTDKGCRAQDEVCIDIFNDHQVYIPNTFTPNNDGINDVFYVFGTGIKDFKLTIYDKWGTKLFTTTDLAEGWNGMYRGEICEQGTYVYYAEFTPYKGKHEIRPGHVNIIRGKP